MNNQYIKACLGLVISIHAAYAADPSVSNTKKNINHINHKINQLQQALNHQESQYNSLNAQLSTTEKKISKSLRSLYSLEKELKETKHAVQRLQTHISELNQQLKQGQTNLANHLRARHQMGQHHPIKWLLNQQSPQSLNRLLVLYQYLIQSQQHYIDKVQKTQKSLDIESNQLNLALKKQQQLKETLSQHQNALQKEKKQQAKLINSLNQDIHNKKQQLKIFQQNKAQLSKLLTSLAHKSRTQPSLPFTRMRHKLPLPVKTPRKKIKNMQQGLLFYANEGSPVSAVYPGKVVFSDWLRGYGLLLIIDHGRGYMSLYAHNEALFKQKGETVKHHEQIASVGHSGGIQQNGLYFEIRHRGKTISPLDWLS